jgi:hypothetical protein
MKIAYLYFANTHPRLMARTVEFLSGEDASFFIHIDGKSDIRPFECLRAPKVVFTDRRIRVYWAEYSGVDAILLLIRQALAAPSPHDYFVLLSGSEFPLRSRRYIHAFLEKHRGEEFITMMKMPAPGKPLARIDTLRFPSTRPGLRLLFRALAKVGLAHRDHRKYLGGLEPWSGITWWALSREACQYVSDYADAHPGLAKFFEYVHAPEETFIHTILGNSPFKSQIRRNLMFEDWSGDRPRLHPEMITAKHVEYFESLDEVTLQDLHGPGEMLFARKFSDDDFSLVDRIAAMIVKKERL